MVLTIKNFESQNVGPGVVETAPTNLVGVAGTLKATLTWTSATGESGVTWTEEKLVRKEGSAPSGSMDGTTVATITTKDTYATAGYEDTGLDNSKTYYYKVFAIYDNGTERGSSDVNVTPTRPPLINTAGVYHDEVNGLISASSDGINWITMADKNLGATTARNSGDALGASNCGGYFQWGNNYMFPFSGNVTSSDTKPNADNYGPGNYYNSNVYITNGAGGYWDTGNNRNLWGDITDTLAARQGPCDTGFHVPTKSEMLSLYNIWTSLGGGSMDGDSFSTTFKMPYNGYFNGTIQDRERFTYFWTSSVEGNTFSTEFLIRANHVSSIAPFSIGCYSDNRSYAFSIRPFKNEAVQPDETRTVLYQPPTLLSYEEIIALSLGDALTELNSHGLEYYNKLNSEGHMGTLGRYAPGILNPSGSAHQYRQAGGDNVWILWDGTSWQYDI